VVGNLITNQFLSGVIVVVTVVVVSKSRMLVEGFRSTNISPPNRAVSIWLSGWFKLTERIQRGEHARGGWIFVLYAVSWMLTLAVKLGSTAGSNMISPLILTVAGFATFFIRCIPTLNRRNQLLARLAQTAHLIVGVLAIFLSL
jgi:hypothetical protein